MIGPLLYRQDEAPEYTRGLRANFLLYLLIIGLVAVTMLYLRLLNRSHARRRVALGKSAVIVDVSLDSAEEAAARQAARQRLTDSEAVERNEEETSSSSRLGERAFENLTDLQNEEFVFVY